MLTARRATAADAAELGRLGAELLNASDDGAPLYQFLGFTPNKRAMRLIQTHPVS
ncbi:hypothetical protein [Kitasatospora purpeofusca]|uniref:hypothetical protein n=1 Tax=Kitasatospora purpeofusca TaxID=67352 RepID=UPI0038677DA2|nr:hypothetical protein OIP63_00355 [Kitasatospora purpeofusca]